MQFRISSIFGVCLSVCLCSAVQAQTLRASSELMTGARAVAVAPTTPGGRSADRIVALVNSEPITNSEVMARVLRAEQQITRQGGALPPRQELMSQVLERLISERSQLQLAKELNINVPESVIDTAAQNVAQQNQMSMEALRKHVESQGGMQVFRNELRDQILLQRVRERELDARVKPSESELDQFIASQHNMASSKLEVNLAHLLISVPEQATPQQQQALWTKAQRAFDRAQAGESFTTLVREYSSDVDPSRVGELGLRPADRYPTLFVEAAQGLAVGGVVGPIQSPAGFHILKVIDKKQGDIPAVAVMQTHARHILLRLGPQLSESVAHERLAEYKARIVAGKADFATLARMHSQDSSAAQGGDLGWTNPRSFVPEFEEVMDKLKLGEVSDPVTSRFGVHLIQALERRQVNLSAQEQRDLARQVLREKRLDEAYEDWAKEVRARAYVEYRLEQQ